MIANLDLPGPAGGSQYGPVAIIGLSCIFPGAENMAAYWTAIKKCRDALSDIPADHWSVADYYDADPKAEDKTYGCRGGFLAPVPFEPLKYGIVPNDLAAIDTTQLLGLVGADRALKDSGYGAGGDYDHRQTAVLLGVTGALKMLVTLGSRLAHPQLRRALADSGVDPVTAADVLKRFANEFAPWQENSFPGLLGNVTAGRIANRLNLGGTNMVVDAACASSLAAVRQGIMELNQGRTDLVVTGGLDTFSDPFMYTCFSKTPALSPTGDLRAYDLNGDGTMLGEGLGLMVLKRLAEARADGDRIYAVIRAVGSSSDGKGAAIFAPTVQGQARALRDAYQQVDFSPDTVELVEGHGTGTAVGDTVEVEALSQVFSDGSSRAKAGHPWCALGSVKSQIGHTKAAAGAAGLIKAALALYYKTLPPTIKVKQPLTSLTRAESPFYLSSKPRPWLSRGPRRAGVSAFGFGGSNFHCLLEEAGTEKTVTEVPDFELFTFSAQNSTEIIHKIQHSITQKSPVAEARKVRENFNPQDLCRLVMVVPAEKFRALGEEIIPVLSETSPTGWPEGVFFSQDPAGPPSWSLTWSREEGVSPDLLLGLAIDWPELLESLNQEATRLAEEDSGLTPLGLVLYPPNLATAENQKRWATDLARPRFREAAWRAVNRGVELILARFGISSPPAREGLLFDPAGEDLTFDPVKELSHDGGGSEALARLLGRMVVQGLPVDFKAWPREAEISKDLRSSEQKEESGETPFTIMLTGANYFVKKDFPPASPQNIGIEPTCLTVLVEKMVENSARLHQDFLTRQAELVELARLAMRAGGGPAAASAPGTITVAVEGFPPASLTPMDSSASMLPSTPMDSSVSMLLPTPMDSPTAVASSMAEPSSAAIPELSTLAEVSPEGHSSLDQVQEIVLNTLATETGYPREMLNPDMDLERDLGLDSIKKVEIMAALSEILPDVQGLGVEVMTGDVTVADLVALVRSGSAGGFVQPPILDEVALPAIAGLSAACSTFGSTSSESEATTEILLAVVSRETGYPKDMLSLSLSLEGDLGLDSIKKVEIMAALADELPEADFDAVEALSVVETLGDLVAMAQGKSPRPVPSMVEPSAVKPLVAEPLMTVPSAPPVIVPVAEVSAPVASSAPPVAVVDPGDILLEVVAAETGYPRDMLSYTASLEADLGLDSIKKVEIMAVLSEKMGQDLPESISTEILNGAVTLGDLRDFLARSVSVAPLVPPVSQATAQVSRPIAPLPPAASVVVPPIVSKSSAAAVVVTPPELAEDQSPELQKRKPGRPPKIKSQSPAPSLPEVTEPPVVDSFETTAVTSFQLELLPLRAPLTEVGPGSWGLGSGPVRLVSEPGPLAEALEQSLRRAGVQNVSRVDWDEEFDSTRLEGLILIWPSVPPLEGLRMVRRAFQILKAAATALMAAREKGANPLVLGLTFMGGSFGFEESGPLDSASAGLVGLLKSVAREWTEVRVRAVDLPQVARQEAEVSAFIPGLASASSVDSPVEVGFTEPKRQVTLGLVPYKLKQIRVRHLREGQTLVVTGGARGVTAAVLKEVARSISPHLIILGRTPLNPPEPGWLRNLSGEAAIRQALFDRSKIKPDLLSLARESGCILASREIRNNLLTMERVGAKVTYLAGDFLNPQILDEALLGIKNKYGAIHGFIHGAGVLSDGLLATKRDEDFDLVLNTKVRLAEMILDRLSKEPLNLVAFFSSSTARFGRRGQSDYAAGNEILNKLARNYATGRQGPKCLSINWGPWDGGMVDMGHKRMFKEESVGLIPLDEGARIFTSLIGTPKSDPVEVVVLGPGTEISSLK